jgi:phosphopantothenoylcysteine decarboxylase/phosphopantothenate--cysteine ligase
VGDPLTGRRIVLGVTGSIAAYKALTIASRASASGAEVDVILTQAAQHLVPPIAFQALTHRPVVIDPWSPVGPMALDHVTMAHQADALLVAPATADTMARLALGRASDALSATALATSAPLVIAPAMEPHMWSHPATQAHAQTLRERGACLVGPAEGRTASGETGVGRMAEPEQVIDALRVVLARNGDYAGTSVLVTAGPTIEPIDPVRFMANRSSGRMGYALATAARDRGARTILVSGPVALAPPYGVEHLPVETAREMLDAVLACCDECRLIVMAAAVADFRPEAVSEGKIKKRAMPAAVALVANPDILEALDAHFGDRSPEPRPVRVGFAAETEQLEASARAKLVEKGLDLIVANPVPASFGAAESEAILIDGSDTRLLARRDKRELADAILDRALILMGRSANR